MSSRVQYSLLINSLKSFQGVALAAANPRICTCAFHQVNAIPSKVPVAYLTLRASGHSHISNTDSSFSNQWRSPTAPSVPLKVLGRQSMKFLKVQTGCCAC
ncbi:hypothetical protein HanRHA438_Chr17g0816961 [Helianthus annuus]|nr:hypothetical protein HanRHA438_Chr17g0816961 [Helianthus annuus]